MHKAKCYVEMDFTSLFSVEDKQDPVSVKSRTRYAIMYCDVQLQWVSKLQTQVASSTMEAEYITATVSVDAWPNPNPWNSQELFKHPSNKNDAAVSFSMHYEFFNDTAVATTNYKLEPLNVYNDNQARMLELCLHA